MGLNQCTHQEQVSVIVDLCIVFFKRLKYNEVLRTLAKIVLLNYIREFIVNNHLLIIISKLILLHIIIIYTDNFL